MKPCAPLVLRAWANLVRGSSRPPGPACNFHGIPTFESQRTKSSAEEVRSTARVLQAITVSYVEALGGSLDVWQLPWNALQVMACIVSNAHPATPYLDTAILHLKVYGGSVRVGSRYHIAAQDARDRSLIAQAIRGQVVYFRVGEITVLPPDATVSRHEASTSVGVA